MQTYLKKSIQLSDKLHNKGLERLKAGDLQQGITMLQKSVLINKNNVPSQNLLGLALYETGHIGDALTHWIISQNIQPEKNPATKYIDNINKNPRKLEALNDSIGLYNQALEKIKQGSDDLAIIQLKKATEINPRFIDALNLLTLCYLIQSDRDRAKETVERALATDPYNNIALNYYAIIHPNKPKPLKTIKSTPKPPPAVKGPYKNLAEDKPPRNFHLAELLTFLIGVVITIGVCYFLVIPAFEDSHASEMLQAEMNHADNIAAVREQVREEERINDGLQLDIANLYTTIAERDAELDRQRRINHANQAYWFYLDDDLRRAVDMLTDFNRAGIYPDIIERIDLVLEDAYPRLGASYFSAGETSFNANDLYGALIQLENAQRFLTDEATQWNRMLFMLGSIYYQHGRIDEAYFALAELSERAAPNFPNFTGTQRTAINNMINSIDAQR